MKNIATFISIVTFAILTIQAAETVAPHFVREPGDIGLGKTGSLLSIITTKDGKASWTLAWTPVSITKADYFKSRGWFSYVESPERVWFYDGIDDLMVVEKTPSGISQNSALYKPVVDSCPAEVLRALPENVKTRLYEKR